jgi:hypothetical protein
MLFRILIASICILYIIRSIVRIFVPMLFQSVINKAQEQARQQQQPPRPDGRVKVDYKPDTKKSSVPDSEGEFVDYEEIK